MYQFKEGYNRKCFFKFDKMLVKTGRWAKLRKASKSVYPVIAVHCDRKGFAFPSQETIAALAGCTPKTVRTGLEGLLGFPGFKISSRLTERGHRQKLYHFEPCPDEKGRFFALFKHIFEGGHWCQLPPSAHALYPVIKTFAFFDSEEYCAREDLEYAYDCQAMIESGEFAERKYDFFNADRDVLAEHAGIGISTTYEALPALEECNLIEPTESIDGYPTWKVFRLPPTYYKRTFLNDQIAQRYGTLEFTH
jgi:hypothetical protein